MVTSKKGLKIGRALRSAARLPIRVSTGRGSGRNSFLPIPGEAPIVTLRVRVLSCQDLVAKDRSGFSDPFVSVTVLGARCQTPVCKRTLSPVFTAKDATFDFPIYPSLAEKLGAVEFVAWDKDVLRKEYLGEFALPLDEWFKGNAYDFEDLDNQPFSVNLISSRATTNASGTMHIKIGFVHPPNATIKPDFGETYKSIIKRSRPSLVSAPPTRGIGTIRSHQTGPEYEDDGLSSDEADDQEGEASDDEDETELKTSTPDNANVFAETSRSSSPDLTPTPSPTAVSLPATQPARHYLPSIPKILAWRSPQSTSSPSCSGASTPSRSSTQQSSAASETTSKVKTGRRKKIPGLWNGQKGRAYELEADNDIVGIVMLEIHGATDLPRLRNMMRTGWDMDPFVVVSFGKRVFRTRVIRHSLNPVWDEKLLFHVRKYEKSFRMQLTVLDWDKLTSNDHVGDAAIEIAELAENVPNKDPDTGLYPEEEDGTRTFQEYKVPLATAKEMPWEAKHNPTLTFRAKYQPYDALRQRLWSQLLKQYDVDDTRTLSHIEVASMLDSLGSTLSMETVDSFFTRWDKNPRTDELTYPEAIQCFETEICRPNSEKKRIKPSENEGRERDHGTGTDASSLHTPNLHTPGTQTPPLRLDSLTFSGPTLHIGDAPPSSHPGPQTTHSTDPSQTRMADQLQGPGDAPGRQPHPSAVRQASTSSSAASDTENAGSGASSGNGSGSGSGSGSSDEAFERVINIKNCPLCHRPRLNSKAERDIVTHLAVCASQDWARVDRVMVSNFVTAVQAQRKWYTNVLSKVSAGNYKIGANSANIIVQDRITGQLVEEKMQVYVRLGIRLLYKGARSRLEGARARKLLKSLTIKQGVKYDLPESAREIPAFIQFHNLDVNEISEPLTSFKTFNQFFYRKLKPDARPVETPDDPNRLVSGADCRLMAFETTSEATRLWIKGREFTVARLLGDAYKDQAERYVGGALVIFRLAPQDYHRFHSPVDGTIGPMTYISGEYYTVNPQAIRTTLDVYGENARKIVPIDSPQFGRVMAVCIGAMMVGSIQTTVSEGDFVKRGQEFGYFAFGGSTIVCLFEKNVVEWDEDLLINGRASLETLVRVGMGIGRLRGSPAPLVNIGRSGSG